MVENSNPKYQRKTKMIIEKVKKLSNIELNIKVGELCGFKDIYKEVHPAITYFWGARDRGKEMIPDYANDLNAMHRAESLISDELIGDYVNNLRVITGGETPQNWGHLDIRDSWLFGRATARKRAEALILTLTE